VATHFALPFKLKQDTNLAWDCNKHIHSGTNIRQASIQFFTLGRDMRGGKGD